MDIVEFLRARLDEDAKSAEELGGIRWYRATHVGDEYNVAVVTPRRVEIVSPTDEIMARCGVDSLEDGEERAGHIARWDPARVLAEVEAKRRIVDEIAFWYDHVNKSAYPGFISQPGAGDRFESLMQVGYALALPYADHPDYLQEWA